MSAEARNPYTPGPGIFPPYLAGRESATRILDRARDAVEAEGAAAPLVVSGMRGMGKTVLLLSFRDHLRAAGWLCPGIGEFDSSHRGLAAVWADLAEELGRISPHRLPKPRRRRWGVDEVDFKATAGVGLAGPQLSAEAGSVLRRGSRRADAQEELRRQMLELARWLEHKHMRAALLFDEAQDASLQDLGLLAEIGHEASKERRPLVIVFAGLTPLHDKLVRARTYASRFTPVEVDALSEAEAGAALEIPATEAGVSWERKALGAALDFARGVPYHLQMIGLQAWERRAGDRIAEGAVEAAVGVARADIEKSMYRPLWNKASDGEQEYLLAMALADRGRSGIAVADVLRRLGKSHADASPLRTRLIRKGLIHPSRHSYLDFSYPGFDRFVAAQKR
ncbi:MAG: ATP-binding protein [Chloroflexota bacterium]